MTIVAGTDIGVEDFLENAWKGGEFFVDEEESVKRSLGGRAYKNWWLLRPSVARHLASYMRQFGHSEADLMHEKTTMLGGTLVLSKDGEVLHEYRETSTFDNGSAADLLKAVQSIPGSAPLQQEVCK